MRLVIRTRLVAVLATTSSLLLGSVLVGPGAQGAVGVTSGAAVSATGGAGSAVTLPRPAGVVEGDYLVASFTADQLPSVTPPVGWTAAASRVAITTGAALFVFGHSVTDLAAEPGSYSFGLSPSTKWGGTLASFHGVDATTPWDSAVSVKQVYGGSVSVPGVVTTTPGAMLVGGVGVNRTDAMATPPSGWTEAAESSRAGQGNEIAYQARSAAGTTGGVTFRVQDGTDVAGWVRALRPASSGNTGSTPTADTTAPETTISAAPSRSTTNTSASFSFSANERSTFVCSLDESTPAPCASPQAYDGLTIGSHTFSVRATDSAGNADPSPAGHTWQVTSAVGSSTAQPQGPGGTWSLAFQDEFGGSSLDRSRWIAHEGRSMNNVTTRARNVGVSSGNLVLTLESSTSGAFISSAPYDGAGANGYTLPVGGVAEARISFPGSSSEQIYNWPAWWTSGPNWPAAGEHDIVEGLGGKPTVNYHSPSGAHNYGTIPGAWNNAFHTYTLHRKAGSADVYWDGQLVKSYPTDDNGERQALLLNVGASSTRAAQTGTVGQVRVDYVRAWQ